MVVFDATLRLWYFGPLSYIHEEFAVVGGLHSLLNGDGLTWLFILSHIPKFS
jgi:hypothetical protein